MNLCLLFATEKRWKLCNKSALCQACFSPLCLLSWSHLSVTFTPFFNTPQPTHTHHTHQAIKRQIKHIPPPQLHPFAPFGLIRSYFTPLPVLFCYLCYKCCQSAAGRSVDMTRVWPWCAPCGQRVVSWSLSADTGGALRLEFRYEMQSAGLFYTVLAADRCTVIVLCDFAS